MAVFESSASRTSGLAPLATQHRFSVMGDDVDIVVHHHAMHFAQQCFHGDVCATARHHGSDSHGFHGGTSLFSQAYSNALIYYLNYTPSTCGQSRKNIAEAELPKDPESGFFSIHDTSPASEAPDFIYWHMPGGGLK